MRRLAAGLALVLLASACGDLGTTTTTIALDVEQFDPEDAVLLDVDQVAAILAGEQPGPEYSSNPPTSGMRAADAPRCGIHRVAIPNLYQAASLAQGTVLVQYRASFTADARDAVEQAVRPLGPGVIAAPNPSLDSAVVLTAWGVMMRLPFAEPGLIEAFVQQYGGNGPSPQECPFVVDDA